jgi:hypothetical protein
MTIYDQDYIAGIDYPSDAAVQEAQKLAMQAVEDYKKQNTAVSDSIAENPVQVQPQAEVALEDTSEQSPDARKMEDMPQQVSDKEINFRAMREELKREREGREKLEEQLEYWKREIASRPQREPEAPRKRYEESLANDDLVTGAQFKQAMQEREETFHKTLAEQQLFITEQMTRLRHPDYDEVTSKYAIPLIENDADIAQAFVNSPNKASYLYKIGKLAMGQQNEPQVPEKIPQTSAFNKAERMVQNARKPGTLSQAVGGQSSISKLDYYQQMSDQDFHALVNKNLEML